MALAQILPRRGTSAQWIASNPVLASGEIGFDSTVKRMKIGDGNTVWSGLPWATADGATIARLADVADQIADATGANDAVMTATAADGSSAFRQALDATIASISSAAIRWQPAGGATAAQNRTSLQAAVDRAVAIGADLMIPEGVRDVAGRVNVTAPIRIFGVGRTRSVIRQTQKAVPTFYVTGQDVRVEDFGVTGPGLDVSGMTHVTYQESNGVRVECGAHGFQARRMRFQDIYIGVLVRPFPNPATVATPIRTKRFVADDIEAANVWSALHGGPFDDPYVNNIRGTYNRATSSNTDADGPPHLVYINTVIPVDGVYTDAFYSRGGTFTNLQAWDGPDFIGAAVSFKHMRGASIDGITARNTRGVLELLNLVDCSIGTVVSTDDKYPAAGGGSERASIAFTECERVAVGKVSISFARVDHGRAVRFESTSADNRIDVLDVVDNSTTDRSSGATMFDTYVQGLRNTIGQATFTNKGAPRYAAVVFAATGSYGRILDPRVGDGFLYGVRVNPDHPKALVDFDPARSTIARNLSGAAKLSVGDGAYPMIRDRSVGQAIPRGFVDEFERGVTVSGLAATDDGKAWLYRDSGSGNPNSWQIANDRAAYVGTGARALALADAGSADGVLRTTVAALGSGFGNGLVVRATDINNYIGLMFSTGPGNGQLDLHKRVAGARTSIAAVGVDGTVGNGSVVEIVLAGASVSVRVGGVEVIGPQNVAEFATVGLHGLLGTSDGTGLRWGRLEFV